MSNRIISQGCYDTACFPYSIMNAYKTLIKPEIQIFEFLESVEIWQSIMKLYPQPGTLISNEYFFSHFINSGLENVDPLIDMQFDHILDSAMNILDLHNIKLRWAKLNLNDIKEFDFSNSAILVTLEKPVETEAGCILQNHSICLNGRNDEYYNMACSFTIHSVPYASYYEKRDESNRYYNNRIKIDDLNEDTIGAAKSMIYSISC